MNELPGFQLTIPGDVAEELRREVRSGRMPFAEFVRRLAERTGHTGPRSLLLFLYETYLED